MQGTPLTAVEGDAALNDLCLVPNTGMFFAATETQKMLSYFVPVSFFKSGNSVILD